VLADEVQIKNELKTEMNRHPELTVVWEFSYVFIKSETSTRCITWGNLRVSRFFFFGR